MKKYKLTVLKVYTKPDRKKVITANAKTCQESVSSYLEKLGCGYEPVSSIDLDLAKQFLARVGDMNRAGGLLKMLLTNDERLNDIGRDMALTTIDAALVDIRIAAAKAVEVVDAILAKQKA